VYTATRTSERNDSIGKKGERLRKAFKEKPLGYRRRGQLSLAWEWIAGGEKRKKLQEEESQVGRIAVPKGKKKKKGKRRTSPQASRKGKGGEDTCSRHNGRRNRSLKKKTKERKKRKRSLGDPGGR